MTRREKLFLMLGCGMGFGLAAIGAQINRYIDPQVVFESSQARSDDEVVIEAVLLHFLQDHDGEIPIAGERQEIVLLHKVSPEKIGMVMPDQVNSYLKSHRLPESLIEALYRRNKGAANFDALQTDYSGMRFDSRIEVGDFTDVIASAVPRTTGPHAKLAARAKGWFQCYAPGYSDDGRTAVVRAWVGPSMHGAIATYLLERKDSSWQVMWREFTSFV